MKHTKGKWIENPKAKGNIQAEETGRSIASCMGYTSNVSSDEVLEENLANGKLIKEAGNVTNETGYTPRQLAEQKAEILEALKESQVWMKKFIYLVASLELSMMLSARAEENDRIIKKATQ